MSGEKLADLSPLEGMKLTLLVCIGTQVSDLSPLQGMPLPQFGLLWVKDFQLVSPEAGEADLPALR